MEDNQKENLVDYEKQFYDGITGLVLKQENNQGLAKLDFQVANSSVRKKINVDVNHLAEMTDKYVSLNEKQTDEQIAIRLLEDMVSNGKTRFMRKIAKEMLKEKWWMKK